jgi:molybdopterin synthase sulfur carrier subunit
MLLDQAKRNATAHKIKRMAKLHFR